MAKARVGARVKAAVGGKKSHNQSQDLVSLTEKYGVFCKRLQALVGALKGHYASMQGIAKSRHMVAQHLAALSKETPLFAQTGELPTEQRSSAVVLSYLSVQEGVAGKAKMYCAKYGQFVIDYAVEWEKVVTTRVNKGLRAAQEYRRELDHYQGKVESLRQTANATMAKGKQVDQKTAEKLTRNEEKLIKVRQTHDMFVSSLCVLIDEVTDRAWRDLHPLLVKIAQFEVTLSGDEAKALASLNTVVGCLKQLAVTHGIKPQARLKDLDSLDPTQLSTKPPGSNTLAIESGLSGLAFGDTSSALTPTAGAGMYDQRLPPGTVAPQGMGGFPVSVQSSDSLSNGYGVNRNTSVGAGSTGSVASGYGGSSVGAPSTMDMMAINASAAPPPTVDSLSAAFGTAPSSAPFGGISARKQSMDSFDSGFSGASAPPPAAPPPPPPAQFGAPGAANPNPFGPAPPAPASYGAPNPYGSGPPAPVPYGATSYGAPNPYGGGAPSPSSYGAPQASPLYGSAPPNYGQPPMPGYGQPPPPQYSQNGQYGQYGQQPGGGGTNPFG